MLLHIGNGKTVRGEEIIGIFDLDNATISHTTRAYLSSATRAGEVTYADSDIPRAFLVTAEKKSGISRKNHCKEKEKLLFSASPPPGGGMPSVSEEGGSPREKGLPIGRSLRSSPPVAFGATPLPEGGLKDEATRNRHPIRKKREKTPPPAQRVLLSHVSSTALHSRADRPIDMSEE